MYRTLFCSIIIAVIFSSSFVIAQEHTSDTLSLTDGFWGLSYMKGTQEISSEEFEQLLHVASDKSIFEMYSGGTTQRTIAHVVSFAGGFCLGYGLVEKPMNTGLTIAGAVVGIAAFILDNNAKNKMVDAVDKYNSLLKSSSGSLPFYEIEAKKYLFSVSITL